jgi:hypothetical protein
MHRPHQGLVDEETAVAYRITGDVVAGATHGNEQLLVARELDRVDDVGGTQAANHEAQTPVDHAVPDRAGSFVTVLSGQRDGAAHLAAQGRQVSCGIFSVDASSVRMVRSVMFTSENWVRGTVPTGPLASHMQPAARRPG